MTKHDSYFAVCMRLLSLVPFCFAACCFADRQVVSPDQEVEIHNLASSVARSKDPADVLMASLETLLNDKDVCCGKDSALADSLSAADPLSLKDVASRLDGRHLLSDGRPIMVKATYVPGNTISSDLILKIEHQQAALLAWDSHIYVVYGVTYHWVSNSNPENGSNAKAVIHKLRLFDVRYSDSRRNVVFDRDTDASGQLQGMLLVEFHLQ